MKRLFSLTPLAIILFVGLFEVTYGYLKVSLQRRSEEYDINTSQIVSKNPKITKCPLDITKLRANTSVVTELCFHRDVSFTIETLIGDIKFNYEVAGLGLDLHSPLSWLKSSACHSCATNTTGVTFKQMQNMTCNGVCVFNPMQTDFIVTNKYKQGKFASITSNTQMLYGEYILSKFSFLAYDPDRKKSLFKYIEEQFEMDTFEKYESLISFPSLKMIAATKLIGYEKYPADGGIGLGMISEERDSKIENGVDLMQALANAEQEIDKRIFGIYINELGDIFKDYALVLGGIDYQYSHRQNQNIEYVPVNVDSGHNWSLPLESITYNVPSADVNLKGIKDESTFNTISTKKQSAILSLSTSFIALPKDEIMQLIQVMNRFGEADCKLVDLTYMAVYCLNFHTDTLNTFEITFNFASGVKLSLDYRHMVRKCNLYPELLLSNDQTNLNDCLLNFQLSPTDFVILGEPFLKKHYTIFDLDNSKVGFLPAADNTFWGSEFYYQPSFTRYIVRISIVIFVLGMVFIVCIAQFTRFLKWFRRKWDGDDTSYSYPSEKLAFAHRQQVDSSFNDQSFNDLELSARQADLYELKQQQIQEEQANQDGSQENQQYQNASTNEDIQEHDNNRFNIYPDIPQPPGSNNNEQGYSYDNHHQEQEQQQNEQRYDHGFNFVESNNNNNPFTENHGI